MTKRSLLGNSARLAFLLLLAVAFSITATSAGQDKKQKKVKQDTKEDPMPMPPIPTADELDRNIGEMLGAWQVGDVDAMHKFYADDATFTSGAFEPPIVGFQNYVASYQKARTRFEGMQLIRKNTVDLFPHGFRLGFLSMGITGYRGRTAVQRARSNDRWFSARPETNGSSSTITRRKSATLALPRSLRRR